MADTFNISNDQAAMWAQEDTLRRLLGESRASNKYLEEFLKTNMSREQLDAIRQTAEAARQNTRATTASSGAFRRAFDDSLSRANRDLEESLSGSFGRIANRITNLRPDSLIGGLQTASEAAGNSLMNLNSSSIPLMNGFTKLSGGLLLFGAAVLEGWNVVSDLSDNFAELYQNGINFSDGLQGLTEFSYQTALTTGQATKVMAEFSATVAYLGTDRTAGLIKQFNKLTKNGAQFGLSNEQAAQAALEYADILRNTGALRGMSDVQLAKNAQVFNSEITLAAQATGKNRKELEKTIKALMATPDATAQLRSLPPALREVMPNIIAQFSKMGEGGEMLSKSMIAYLSGGIGAMSEEMISGLTASGTMGQFMALADDIRSGRTDVTDSLVNLSDALTASSIQPNMILLARYGNAFAQTVQQLAMGNEQLHEQQQRLNDDVNAFMKEYNDTHVNQITFEQAKEKFLEKQVQNQDRIADVQRKFAEASSKIQVAFQELATAVIEPLAPALKFLADVVITMTTGFKSIVDWTQSVLQSLGLGGGKQTEESEGNSAAYDNSVIGGAVIGGVGAAGYAGYKGYKLARGAIGLLPGGRRGRGQGNERDGGGGTPLEEGLNALSNPAMGPGLRGAAGGISAFANPTVLAGAAGLAAAIGLIGGGIAGATWLMGKSLPTLADGLKSFADIDGQALASTGWGMTQIGLGLVAMGVGEVASAWGSIASGITSLFAEDPIDKLKRFSEVSEPLTQAARGMREFATAYPDAMNLINTVKVNDAAIESLGQVKEMLNADFSTWTGSGPPIIGQIVELSNSIGQLAETSARFSGSPDESVASSDRKYDTMIQLLSNINQKMSELNQATLTQTSDLTYAMKNGNGWIKSS